MQVQLAAPEPTPGLPTSTAPTGLIEIVQPDGVLVGDAAVDGAALRRVLAALSGR